MGNKTGIQAKDIVKGDVIVWRDGSKHVVTSVKTVGGKVNILAGQSDELGVELNVSPTTLVRVS